MAMVSSLASAFRGIALSSSSQSPFDLARGESAAAGGPIVIEAAHKKGSGSTKNGRDSQAKRLGVKIHGSEMAKPGAIIVRQRGNKFHAGNNVGIGKDYTIFSLIDGEVKFERLFPKKQKVSVYPKEPVPENPDSRRVKKRDKFRALREVKKAKEEARLNRLAELYNTPAKFPQPVFDMSSLAAAIASSTSETTTTSEP